MLDKIKTEIDNFTKDIKDIKGCDKMIAYLSSSYFSTIKLLMFASSSFSIYVRVMVFMLIASVGILFSTLVGMVKLDIVYSATCSVVFFIFFLSYVVVLRKYMIQSIQKVKVNKTT